MAADGNGKSGGLAQFERRMRTERDGIRGSLWQVDISTGLVVEKTHTVPPLVFTVQLSMKGVSSRKKGSVQMHHHGGRYKERRWLSTQLYFRDGILQSAFAKIYLYIPSLLSLKASTIKPRTKWNSEWPGLSKPLPCRSTECK